MTTGPVTGSEQQQSLLWELEQQQQFMLMFGICAADQFPWKKKKKGMDRVGIVLFCCSLRIIAKGFLFAELILFVEHFRELKNYGMCAVLCITRTSRKQLCARKNHAVPALSSWTESN